MTLIYLLKSINRVLVAISGVLITVMTNEGWRTAAVLIKIVAPAGKSV